MKIRSRSIQNLVSPFTYSYKCNSQLSSDMTRYQIISRINHQLGGGGGEISNRCYPMTSNFCNRDFSPYFTGGKCTLEVALARERSYPAYISISGVIYIYIYIAHNTFQLSIHSLKLYRFFREAKSWPLSYY